MGHYFKEWRRKTGVLTLLVACVFMAGWVRSLRNKDTVQFRVADKTIYSFISNRSWFFWQGIHESTPLEFTPIGFHLAENVDDFNYFTTYQSRPVSLADFDPRFVDSGVRMKAWGVPYWSIVIPLTLISLWLLLTKPHPSTQKKTSEPIPEKVA